MQTVDGSLSNVSDKIRWSFDLRSNPIGRHTGREAVPGVVARSGKARAWSCTPPTAGGAAWEQTRLRMAGVNRDGQTGIPSGRWTEGHPGCA